MYFFGHASMQTEFGLKLSWVLLDDWLIPQRQGVSYVEDVTRRDTTVSTIVETLRSMYGENMHVFDSRVEIPETLHKTYYIPLCLNEEDEAYMVAYTNGILSLFSDRPEIFKARV